MVDNPSRQISVYSDGSWFVEIFKPPELPPPFEIPAGYGLFRILHDLETGDGDKTITEQGYRFKRNGIRRQAPEVFNLEKTRKVPMDAEVQRLSYDLFAHFAHRLGDKTNDRWRQLYDGRRAFTNDKGGRGFNTSPCADYISMEDLDQPVPEWDDQHICGGATVLAKKRGGLIVIETIDINNVPTLDEVLRKPYLYFFALTNGVIGIPFDFPQGSISSQNVFDPVAIPLMSDHSKGELTYPVQWVEEVTEIADPYKV